MKTWIISDTHFNHEKIKEYENRPDDFNEIIVSNWNKVITDADLVIHLVDVILGHDSSLDAILSRCNGRKVFARGNHRHHAMLSYMSRGFDAILSRCKRTKVLAQGTHDHHAMDSYMSRGFVAVFDYFIYKTFPFSHAPLPPLPLQTNRQKGRPQHWEARPVDRNIHGHFHRG